MPKLSSQTVTMLDGGAGVLLPRSWMPRLPEVHLHFSDCLLPNTDHVMGPFKAERASWHHQLHLGLRRVFASRG